MTKLLRYQVPLLAIAIIGLGLAAPSAYAGSKDKTVCRTAGDYQRGYNHYNAHHKAVNYNHNTSRHYGNHNYGHSRSHVSYRNDGFNVSLRFGNSHGHRYHNPHHNSRYYSNRGHCNTYSQRKVVVNNSGYWKRIYIQPVYQTRYYRCGTPYRVCVKAGYWKNVWVRGSYCR